MSDDDRWERIVGELVDKTRAGDLVWKASPAAKREDATSDIYEARVLDRDVVLYEYKYQYYIDEDEWHWVREVAIEFTEPLTDHTWRWPRTGKHYELLEAVKRQAFRADEFADAFESTFLKDKPAGAPRRRRRLLKPSGEEPPEE